MPTFSRVGRQQAAPYVRPVRRLETLEAHEAAEDAINLATFRRRHDETMAAAFTQASDAPDEKAARKILDKAALSVSAIESDNPRIQHAYAAYYESAQAQWGDRFARQAKAIKDKQVNDRAWIEIDAAYDKGDVAGAVKMMEYLKVREPENIPRLEQEQADAPFKSAERRAFRDIHSGDLDRAQRAVQELRDMDPTGLPAELLERRHKMIRAGQGEVDYRQNQNYAALYDGLLKMDEEHQSPLDHYNASQELNQAIQDAVTSGQIGAHHAATLQSARRTSDERFARGTMVTADPRVQGMAAELLLAINSQTSDEDFLKARQWMLDNALAIGEPYDGYLKQLHLRRKEPPDGLKGIINLAISRHPIAPEERAPFIELILAKTKGKDIGAKEMNALVAEELVVWGAAHEKFPEGKVATLLGYLETGQRFIGPMAVLSQVASRRDAINLIYQDAWFDSRLRRDQCVQIRAMLDAKYPFGDEQLPLHPSETGRPEPEGGGQLNLRGETVTPPPPVREVGKVYVNSKGQRAEWTGKGWKPVP